MTRNWNSKIDMIRAMCDGQVVDTGGTLWRITENGVEWSPRSGAQWRCHALAGHVGEYAPHEEPNPHPKGTYLWAYEEVKRGRSVTRNGEYWDFHEAKHFEAEEAGLTHEDFVATDWVHV